MFFFDDYYDKDPYAFYKYHLSNFETVMKDTNNNLVTADENDYNCMSYALGIYNDWLCIDAFRPCYGKEEKLNEIFNLCCIELETNWGLRRFSGPSASLTANERMIAFRVGLNDFHFVRRNSDNNWTHKPGSGYICEMTEEELLGEEWGEDRIYPYISEIAFYAVRA